MQDSCGVVFFITPYFKDEGFLEAEINYAIQEKRRKRNKFAIVTLQFVDADGNAGEIPELLKSYVWKTPKTSLEALREIVRALPVMRTGADWRDEVSEEGKAILNATVASDGKNMRQRYHRGQVIQAGLRALIPDQHPRTIAKWVGGLEDLQRRRYVTDKGHKGESFEVTREGFEVADELSEG